VWTHSNACVTGGMVFAVPVNAVVIAFLGIGLLNGLELWVLSLRSLPQSYLFLKEQQTFWGY
jgi:hypothetical protein